MLPNYEWAVQKPKMVQLKGYQYEKMDNDLVYVPETGDYCRQVNGEEFEIVYTAYEAGAPAKSPLDKFYTETVEKNAEKLREDICNSIIYGPSLLGEYNKKIDAHTAILNEVSKPSGLLNFITKSSKTPAYEEMKMEIGGHYCHLCGAEILQENRDTVYRKKHHLRTVNLYECGTIVEKSFKSEGEGYVTQARKQKVILGDNCVEI